MKFTVKFAGRVALVFAALCAIATPLVAQQAQSAPGSPASIVTPELTIPRVQRAPTIEDFLEMEPRNGMAEQMAKVENFRQQRPVEGSPASQRTEAYLGYDEKNLYIVFVCFDREPKNILARMVPRENFVDTNFTGIDELVSITLDTFNDRRRGYVFQLNPYGIQWDGTITEGAGFDASFDALWYSKGQLTPQGFVVWTAIPFKSLRFSSEPKQVWRILLNRDIPRNNEASFWPSFTSRISGFINQAVPMHGLENISPGRNIQFIPYGAFRAFRALDPGHATAEPFFAHTRAEFTGGVDAKVVFKDSLVLDMTVNPDFSQMESDEPQLQTSERFEIFFPEKRPFFIENAAYFRTPINLLFTRRIADPQFGVRLTGKIGRTALGILFADDEAPGERPRLVSHAGKRAYFGVLRVNQEIFGQSTVGLIFTDREFAGGHNRVAGVDTRLRHDRNWTTTLSAVTSSTEDSTGAREAGPAYSASVQRRGRSFNYTMNYTDFSAGFRSDPGFIPRRDLRMAVNSIGYTFHPERKLITWGPRFENVLTWDHSGARLGNEYLASVNFEFARQTNFSLNYNPEFEALRPGDAPGVTQYLGFDRANTFFTFSSKYFRKFEVRGEYVWGERINVDPVAGQAPELARRTQGNLQITLSPLTRLRIDNTYLLFRLRDRPTGESVLNNHIFRSKWNWQFTRELSLRVIAQYDALLANGAHTSLETSKNFNLDFLVTYLLHPGTALYVGYNSNLQNVDLIACPPGSGCSTQIIRRPTQFINDSRGLFAKFSYLIRF